MTEQEVNNVKDTLDRIPFYLNQEANKRFFSMYQEENDDDSQKLNLFIREGDCFSIDIIEQPFHLEYKGLKNGIGFDLFLRDGFGIYEKENANYSAVFNAEGAEQSAVNRGGLGGDLAAISIHFLKSASELKKYVLEQDLLNSFSGLDQEKEGVLVTVQEDTPVFKRVSGKRRPSMLCISLFRGSRMDRPYLDEQTSALAGELFQEDLLFDSLLELAEDGDEDAMGKVAIKYLNGDTDAGIEPDAEKAVFWFRKQAEADDPTGCFNLAIQYLKGEGAEQSFAEALFWMKKAEENGDSDAEGYIPMLEKLSVLKAKADQGDTGAMAELAGQMMAVGKNVGGPSEKQFYAKSVELAEKADMVNEPGACWVLALAYELGRGVQKDMKRALGYYRKGSFLGNLDCQANLGVLFIEGKKVPEDKKKGFELCLKAAEQGHGNAMKAVGNCYQFGYGVQDDMKKAIYWYEKALEVVDDPELARKVMIFKTLEDVDDELDDEDWTPPEGYDEALTDFIEEMSVTKEANDAAQREAEEQRNIEERRKKEEEDLKKIKIRQEEEVEKRIRRKEQIIRAFADKVCVQIVEQNRQSLEEQENVKRDAEDKRSSLGFFKRRQKQEQQEIIDAAQVKINRAKALIANAEIISDIGKRKAAAFAEAEKELFKTQAVKLYPIPEQNESDEKVKSKSKVQTKTEEAEKEILDTLRRKKIPMTAEEIAKATPAVKDFNVYKIEDILRDLIERKLIRCARKPENEQSYDMQDLIENTINRLRASENGRLYAILDKPDVDIEKPFYDVMDVNPDDNAAVKNAIKNDLDFKLRQWQYDSYRRIGYESDIYQSDVVDTRQIRLDILRFYQLYEGQNLYTYSSVAAKSLKDSRGQITTFADSCQRDLERQGYLNKPYRKNDIVTNSLTDKGNMLLAMYRLFYL